MKKELIVEVSVDSVRSALNAEKAGADRIELCQDLLLGGTSPSYGLVKAVMNSSNIPIAVLIRPRAGDFYYDRYEFDSMLYDIEMLKELGVKEIVTGALEKDGRLDVPKMEKIIQIFGTDGVALHRAFDMCNDLEYNYKLASELGIKRILTSGGKNTALEGLVMLKKLNDMEGAQILAGCGVNPDNARKFRQAGINQIHLSAKKRVASAMEYFNPDVAMGDKSGDSEYDIFVSDHDTIKEVIKEFTK